MRKLMLLTAFGAGYVLGAKAGRTRYEQIRSGFRKFMGNPTVQSVVERAEEAVQNEASVVKDKVASAASMAWPRREAAHASSKNGNETGWPLDSEAPYPPRG